MIKAKTYHELAHGAKALSGTATRLAEKIEKHCKNIEWIMTYREMMAYRKKIRQLKADAVATKCSLEMYTDKADELWKQLG